MTSLPPVSPLLITYGDHYLEARSLLQLMNSLISVSPITPELFWHEGAQRNISPVVAKLA